MILGIVILCSKIILSLIINLYLKKNPLLLKKDFYKCVSFCGRDMANSILAVMSPPALYSYSSESDFGIHGK